MKTFTPTRKRGGFTLVEIMVVCAIIGMLLLLVIPNALNNKQTADQKTAIDKAMQLNFAKATYRTLGPRVTQENAWAAMPDDPTRYTALQPSISYSPPSLALFTPSGYSYSLGSSLYAGVVITDLSTGLIVPYQ